MLADNMVGQFAINDDSTKWKFKDKTSTVVMVIDGTANALTASTSLSASQNITAGAFYGDGANLTNVTASAVQVADGPVNAVQFRIDSPVSGEISGSGNFMYIPSESGTSDFLQVTGAVGIEGNLNVCAGTASIAHLSGCSPITVHSPISSSQVITASALYFGNGNGSYLAESPTSVEFSTGLNMIINTGTGITLQNTIQIPGDGVLSSSTHISASAFVVPDGHNIGNATKPTLMYLQQGTVQVDGDIEAGNGPGNESVRLRASGEVSGSGPAYFGSIQTSGSVTLDGGLLSSSADISASAFYGDGAGITGISLINLDAAGSDTNIQFNQNNEFGANAGLVYDGSGSVTISGSYGPSEYIDPNFGLEITESLGGKLTLGAWGNPYLQTLQYYATSSPGQPAEDEMAIGPFNRLQIYQDGQISLSSSANADPNFEMPAGIELVCNPGNGIVAIDTNRVSFGHNTSSLSSDEKEYLWSINSDHTGGEDESAWVKLDLNSQEFKVGGADSIKIVAASGLQVDNKPAVINADLTASNLTSSGRVLAGTAIAAPSGAFNCDVQGAGTVTDRAGMTQAAVRIGGHHWGGSNPAFAGYMTIASASTSTAYNAIQSGIYILGEYYYPNPAIGNPQRCKRRHQHRWCQNYAVWRSQLQ